MRNDRVAWLTMAEYQRLLPPELNLVLQQPLNGRGCFGDVFEATHSHETASSPSPVKRVVRFLPAVLEATKWPSDLLEKFHPLDRVRLPYVSTPRNVGVATGWLYLVYDHHENTLDSLLKNNRDGLSKEEAWNIAEQLIEGLAVLHAIGIAHGDLRPKRIFMDQRPEGRSIVSIGDPLLGEVRSASNGKLVDDDAREYRTQEEKESLVKPTAQADLYALGCIICELVEGSSRNPNRQAKNVGQDANPQPVAPTIGDHHDLAIVVELLFGKTDPPLKNAVALRRELATRKHQIQKKAKRRSIITLTVQLVVLLVACFFTWLSYIAKNQATTATATAQARIEQLEDELVSQKGCDSAGARFCGKF